MPVAPAAWPVHDFKDPEPRGDPRVAPLVCAAPTPSRHDDRGPGAPHVETRKSTTEREKGRRDGEAPGGRLGAAPRTPRGPTAGLWSSDARVDRSPSAPVLVARAPGRGPPVGIGRRRSPSCDGPSYSVLGRRRRKKRKRSGRTPRPRGPGPARRRDDARGARGVGGGLREEPFGPGGGALVSREASRASGGVPGTGWEEGVNVGPL